MTFRTTRQLSFGDCDPSGIAFFPSYLRILVTVLEEFFDSTGNGWADQINNRRMGTPTVTLDLKFERPGFQGDRLDFVLHVQRIGGSSMDLFYEVYRGETRLWTAQQRIVATSLETHKACPWPDDIRAALSQHLEPSDA